MPRPYDKHPDEKLVDSLMEVFEKDVQNITDFASVHGRMMFTVPLTPEEQWQRFANPVSRARVIDRILRDEGPSAVRNYITHMVGVAKKLAREPGYAGTG